MHKIKNECLIQREVIAAYAMVRNFLRIRDFYKLSYLHQ